MPRLEFQPSGWTQFKASSRAAVADYFVSFSTHFRRARWLRQNNQYRIDCVNLYTSQVTSTPPLVNHRDVSDYVAASGPTHVVDGWSFLGRAIEALLRGDGYSAIHFGYYAELRAAM